MLDKEGRLVLGTDLIKKANLEVDQEVQIFFDKKEEMLVILSEENYDKDLYFIKKIKIHKSGRIFIPAVIKTVFPDKKFLPSLKNGIIFIHIL